VTEIELNRGRIVNSARPQWVMMGAEWDGPGVMLLASRTLTAAELDFRARSYEFTSWAEFLKPGAFRPELTLAVHMHDDYVLVFGPTYAECLASLLNEWQPDDLHSDPLPLEAAAVAA
jgi:hypothetical protein